MPKISKLTTSNQSMRTLALLKDRALLSLWHERKILYDTLKANRGHEDAKVIDAAAQVAECEVEMNHRGFYA